MKEFLKKHLKLRLPETYLGFPVDNIDLAQSNIESKVKRKSRGVALIIALMVIFIMMLFLSDLIISSQVNLELAVRQRDNVKAEYLAKSAVNLALFLLSGDLGIDLFLASPQSPMKQNPTDSVEDIWNLLNGIPIGGGSAEMLDKQQEAFGLSKVTDASILDQFKLFDGDFVLNIQDESRKIPINFCAITQCFEVLAMLEGLFSCAAEKAFLDEKKVTGKELAYRIKDWVDSNTKADSESGFSDENDPYDGKKPPYKAKNAPFDSIDELRLIEGWDDEIFAVFSPYLTVFPFQQTGSDKPKININTAPAELLGCLFPKAKSECPEKFAAALKARDVDKSAFVSEGKTVNDFIKESLCHTETTTADDGSTQASNQGSWFQNKSNVFLIEATGVVDDREKKIHAYIERVVPDKKEVKQAYKVLGWKIF